MLCVQVHVLCQCKFFVRIYVDLVLLCTVTKINSIISKLVYNFVSMHKFLLQSNINSSRS